MFYNEQVEYVEIWIESVTNQEDTGAAIDHCFKLYLNTARYEPWKCSSYIPLPKPIASNKAIINAKNNDDKCFKWVLKSALYPIKLMQTINTVMQSMTSQGIVDFPTPVSQAGPRSAVGNVSGYRCVSDCRSRGHEFEPGPVPYFCGD